MGNAGSDSNPLTQEELLEMVEKHTSKQDWKKALDALLRIQSSSTELLLKKANLEFKIGTENRNASYLRSTMNTLNQIPASLSIKEEVLFLRVSCLEQLEQYETALQCLKDSDLQQQPSRKFQDTFQRITVLYKNFSLDSDIVQKNRVCGTEFLNQAKQAPHQIEKISRLQEALKEFMKSGTELQWKSLRSIAFRNCGIVCKDLALELPFQLDHFAKALTYLQQALLYGLAVHEDEWLESVALFQASCMEEMISRAKDVVPKEVQAKQYMDLALKLGEGEARTRLNFEAGNVLFHLSLLSKSTLEFSQDVNMLENAALALRNATLPCKVFVRRNSPILHWQGEAWDQLSSVEISLAMVHARRVIQSGETSLSLAMEDSAELNMDHVFFALDHFMHAARLAQEKDLEAEAIAYSNCAKIYDGILKDFPKAKTYSQRCLSAALACDPQDFSSQPWFSLASKVLRKEQSKVLEAENKERAPFLLQWKDELKAMDKELEKSWSQLLIHVYAKHPLEGKTIFDSGPLTKENGKRAIIRAILHYHPDKVEDKEDRAMFILREEITKRLNQAHSEFK